MRTTLLSIYKIALHVEPEDIVPVGLTHANMQKLKKVFHRYYSAGVTQCLIQHQNWGKDGHIQIAEMVFAAFLCLYRCLA